MTEMQAVIGRVQLRKLPEWTRVRGRNARVLFERFRELPALRVPEPPGHVGHAYYKFYAYVRPELLAPGWDRDRVMQAVNASGVPCTVGVCSEIYLEEAFRRSGFAPSARFPVAKELGETRTVREGPDESLIRRRGP